jgi:putative cardiolipin synthase
VAVRLFNPYAGRSFWERMGALVTDFSRLSRRMHNKFFAADNWLAIVGGRNIGDEYFEARPELDFLDMDVLTAGPVVQNLTSLSFDAYWNSRWAVPLAAFGLAAPAPAAIAQWRSELADHAATMRDSAYAAALRRTPLITQIREGDLAMAWGEAAVVVDDPAKIDAAQSGPRPLPQLFEQLVTEMRGAHQELLLVSPYFVPGEQGVRFLGELTARGVTVRVLTNSLSTTDSFAAFAGYHAYRRALIKAGVELYELKSSAASARRLRDSVGRGSSQASLHAKTFIMDRRRMVVGSLNLDPRSVWINTETGLVIDSPALSEVVARMFEEAAAPAASYRVLLKAPEDGTDGDYVSRLVWRTEENGRMVDHDHEPDVSIPRKLAVILLRMLPIENQL